MINIKKLEDVLRPLLDHLENAASYANSEILPKQLEGEIFHGIECIQYYANKAKAPLLKLDVLSQSTAPALHADLNLLLEDLKAKFFELLKKNGIESSEIASCMIQMRFDFTAEMVSTLVTVETKNGETVSCP